MADREARRTMSSPTHIIGQQFGRLTALEEVGKDATGHKFVRCRCKCGKVCVTRKTALVTGDCQSCGCLQRERSAERSKRRAIPMEVRFWKLVDRNGLMPSVAKGKCWLWTGASNGRYLAQHGRSKKKKQARDVAWFLAHGVWPTRRLSNVCDTAACIRPSHLTTI